MRLFRFVKVKECQLLSPATDESMDDSDPVSTAWLGNEDSLIPAKKDLGYMAIGFNPEAHPGCTRLYDDGRRDYCRMYLVNSKGTFVTSVIQRTV
ncbi:MAG: hypothetical protein ACLTDC_01295 [Lachnospiraceae bacterium]